MTEVPDRLATALAGRYRIERELGAGGMATVWLAHDLKHDRKVAIKVLHPQLAALVGADRFLKEIRTTANLQHPHILPLHDSGDADGLLFYVMPFMGGESLRQRITRDKQLPIADAVRITSEVASALDYAHRQGVIHRDIKPENILLHEGTALVADFGIALAPSVGGSRLTETGMSMGTPPYMSPEQALGERQLDARSDIYAVGAMLYEMLTGAPPFTGPSAQAIVAKVITETPAPPSRLRREIPVPVEDAVLTALQKDPADRFPTAAALQAALVLGGPAGGVRRRRRRMPTLVAVAVLLVGAAAVYLAMKQSATPLLRSITVLPIKTLSGDAVFSEGLRTVINDDLGRLPGLTVIAYSSGSGFRDPTIEFRAVGQALGVDAVVIASLQQANDSVRLTVQLVDVHTGKTLRSLKYDRAMKSLFALEDDLSHDIAAEIGLTFTSAQLAASIPGRTENPEAHQMLVRAKGFAQRRTSSAMETAVTLYQDALERDPNYAEAWAGLAQAQNLRAVFLGQAPTPRFDSALVAIQHALALDSNSADAHQALGFYHVMHDRNYPEAGRQFTKALELNRNDPETWLFRAWYYSVTNHLDSTVLSIRHARDLDPTAGVIGIRLANVLYWEGRTKSAEDELKKVLALDSTYQPARGWLAQVYAADGQCDKAAEQVRHFDGKHVSPTEVTGIPITWALCGPRPQAMRYVDSMATQARKGEYVSGFRLAQIYAALGDTTKVHVWLDYAVKNQDWSLYQLRGWFKEYRSKPWFQVMLQQLKLIDD